MNENKILKRKRNLLKHFDFGLLAQELNFTFMGSSRERNT